MSNDIAIQTQPAVLSINFEELKEKLEQDVAKYDIVVTADTVADAKKLATELNKSATMLDTKRKEAVAKVSEPIKTFDEQMKELVTLYKDGRQKILDQVQVFENETRQLAEELLTKARDEFRAKHGVDDEFHKAEFDDLIKLTSVTAKGNLSKAARDTLEARVRDERALQDRTNMRLMGLENASYKAGLSAPLTRDHVEHFLFADDKAYEASLQKIMQSEIERQEVAEKTLREKMERENQQREAAQKAAEPAPAVEQQAPPAPAAAPPAPQQPRPQVMAGGTASPKVTYTVTCTFAVTVDYRVKPEAVEEEARRVMDKAGITTLTGVQVERNSSASAA